MNYSELKFDFIGQNYVHNLDADFGLLALWKDARPFRTDIRNYLNNSFEVILESEIEWSDKHFHSNAARLYEEPLFYDDLQAEFKSNHAKKLGSRKFIIFIIKDKSPKYTFAKSVSGKIELSNMNIVSAKYKFREWILHETGERFGVHSTNNIYEFFFQVPLLLGVNIFNKIISGDQIHIDGIIKKDLEGAGGWNSYKNLFELLNITNNYLILRGFETLPIRNEEKDLDVLVEDYQKFASTLGLLQSKRKPYKGHIVLDDVDVSVDIRYLGDKYYCALWEQNMLAHKSSFKGFFIPRKDEYFFSLLHHCKVQKMNVKDKYYDILDSLASELNFSWFKKEMVDDDETVINILNGYYIAQNYYYEDPLDLGVYKNSKIINFLIKGDGKSSKRSPKGQFINVIKFMLPDSGIILIKKILKR